MYPRRLALGAMLVFTMSSATFAIPVFGVLASELISSMGIKRWQIGLLVTAATLGGAMFSPMIGRWVDAVGGHRAINTTLVISAVVLFCVGIAQEFSFVIGAAFLAGLAMAISNPATNKRISMETAPSQQGFLVGLKQSGSLISAAIGGMLLPVFTGWWGWRWAVIVFAVAPLAVAVRYMVQKPRLDPGGGRSDGETQTRISSSPTGRLPGWMQRLTVYAFLMGAGITSVLTYLPLYAQEVLGMSQGQAGLTLSVAGWVGMFSLVGWTRLADGRFGSQRCLIVIGCLGMALGLVLAYGPTLGWWSIWLAALLTGLSGSSWNAVCMLAVIQGLSESLTGKGSGVMAAGALGGAGVGAPLLGWSVDHLGVYTPGWLGVAALFAAGTGVMVTVRGARSLPQSARGA